MSKSVELVLPEAVYRKLEEEAKKRGISVAELLMILISMVLRGEVE